MFSQLPDSKSNHKSESLTRKTEEQNLQELEIEQ